MSVMEKGLIVYNERVCNKETINMIHKQLSFNLRAHCDGARICGHFQREVSLK